MKQSLIIFLSIMFLHACKGPSKEQVIEKEILALDTDDKRKDFLEAIYDKDQGIRDGLTTSDEDNQKLMKVDASNTAFITKYLDIHGYPNRDTLSIKSAATPWLVLHHYGGLDHIVVKEKYFPFMWQAYKTEQIDGGSMAFYLYGLYRSRMGKRFDMPPGPFRQEEELDTLIKLLELPLTK